MNAAQPALCGALRSGCDGKRALRRFKFSLRKNWIFNRRMCENGGDLRIFGRKYRISMHFDLLRERRGGLVGMSKAVRNRRLRL